MKAKKIVIISGILLFFIIVFFGVRQFNRVMDTSKLTPQQYEQKYIKHKKWKFKTPIIVIILGVLLVIISAFLKIQKLEIASILLSTSFDFERKGIDFIVDYDPIFNHIFPDAKLKILLGKIE